jgi:hypothetical protein
VDPSLSDELLAPPPRKNLTEIRADHPEYRALNAQSAQLTLKAARLGVRGIFPAREGGKEPSTVQALATDSPRSVGSNLDRIGGTARCTCPVRHPAHGLVSLQVRLIAARPMV